MFFTPARVGVLALVYSLVWKTSPILKVRGRSWYAAFTQIIVEYAGLTTRGACLVYGTHE